jgi:hypothetical protein
MTEIANYFISNSNRAYRSEIALFRHEKATADDCWMVEARAGASTLYEIVGPGDRVTITAHLDEAWDTFRARGANDLHSIAVAD